MLLGDINISSIKYLASIVEIKSNTQIRGGEISHVDL